MSTDPTSVSNLYQALAGSFHTVKQEASDLAKTQKSNVGYPKVILDALDNIEDFLTNNHVMTLASRLNYSLTYSVQPQPQQGTSTNTTQNQGAPSDLASQLNYAQTHSAQPLPQQGTSAITTQNQGAPSDLASQLNHAQNLSAQFQSRQETYAKRTQDQTTVANLSPSTIVFAQVNMVI